MRAETPSQLQLRTSKGHGLSGVCFGRSWALCEIVPAMAMKNEQRNLFCYRDVYMVDNFTF